MRSSKSNFIIPTVLFSLTLFFLIIYVARIMFHPSVTLDTLYDWEVGLILSWGLFMLAFGTLIAPLTSPLPTAKKIGIRIIIMLMAVVIISLLVALNIDPTLWIFENFVN